MVRRQEEMRREERTEMRGGRGTVRLCHLLEKEELLGKARMCARITLPEGASIGLHDHTADAEMYILIRGEALADDNGTKKPMKAGDVMFTANGEVHAIENTGRGDMEMIAVVLL